MSNQVAKQKSLADSVFEITNDRVLKINGGNEAYYKAECATMATLISDSLKECTAKSIALSFLEAQRYGVSLSPTMREAYVVPNGKVASFRLGAMGWAKMCINSGAIQGYTQPVIVYEGDTFSTKLVDGERTVQHDEKSTTRTMDKVVAVYMYITLANGQKTCYLFRKEDIAGWVSVSSKIGNALKSPQNLKTKCIKHALKSLPAAMATLTNKQVAGAPKVEVEEPWEDADVVEEPQIEQLYEGLQENEDLDV